jgi:hypothetical protein
MEKGLPGEDLGRDLLEVDPGPACRPFDEVVHREQR